MQFGERVRELRASCGLTQKQLADRLEVSASYINKVENGRLHFGEFPSERFIHKLAGHLQADEDELLLLANKVPSRILSKIQEKPDLFRRLVELDRQSLRDIVKAIERKDAIQK